MKKGTFDLHYYNFLGNTNACLLFWSEDEHEIHKVIFWLLPWIFKMLQIIFVHIFSPFFSMTNSMKCIYIKKPC